VQMQGKASASQVEAQDGRLGNQGQFDDEAVRVCGGEGQASTES
jgi:hypothetical protein